MKYMSSSWHYPYFTHLINQTFPWNFLEIFSNTHWHYALSNMRSILNHSKQIHLCTLYISYDQNIWSAINIWPLNVIIVEQDLLLSQFIFKSVSCRISSWLNLMVIQLIFRPTLAEWPTNWVNWRSCKTLNMKMNGLKLKIVSWDNYVAGFAG